MNMYGGEPQALVRICVRRVIRVSGERAQKRYIGGCGNAICDVMTLNRCVRR
jgi:hypothetical protein